MPRLHPAQGGEGGHMVIEPLGDALAVLVLNAITGRVVPATATAIAQLVGVPRDEVTQRLALLQKHDVVEPITTGSGADEVVYRATRDALVTDEEWARLPVADRRQIFVANLEIMEGRIWSAVARGGFDAPDIHLSWLPADLDEEGYNDVVRATLELVERVRDIQAEVVQRRAEGSTVGGSVKTDLMLLHFQREGREGAGVTIDHPAEQQARMYQLSEDIADGLALEAPDWPALGAAVRELVSLVQRFDA